MGSGVSAFDAKRSVFLNGGVLLFNPGGVHQWNPTTVSQRLKQNPGWFEWCWLQAARHLRRYQEPSVGILEVSESGIVTEVIEL